MTAKKTVKKTPKKTARKHAPKPNKALRPTTASQLAEIRKLLFEFDGKRRSLNRNIEELQEHIDLCVSDVDEMQDLVGDVFTKVNDLYDSQLADEEVTQPTALKSDVSQESKESRSRRGVSAGKRGNLVRPGHSVVL